MAELAETAEQHLEEMVTAISAKGDFPAAARVIQRLHEAVRKENCNALDVAQVILTDPGLSAKVLRVVNSSFYRPRGEPVSTITRAVFLLGFEAIRDLTTGLLLLDEVIQASGGHPTIRDVLRQCVTCGSVARALSSTVGYPSPEEAYLLGLFANWGQLCLAAYYPEQYDRAAATARDQKVPLERALGWEFGVPSTALATAMLSRWNFPSTFSDYFRHPHTIGDGPVTNNLQRLFAIVDVANDYAASERARRAGDEVEAAARLQSALGTAETTFGRRKEDLQAAFQRGADDARENMPLLRVAAPHGAAPKPRPASEARHVAPADTHPQVAAPAPVAQDHAAPDEAAHEHVASEHLASAGASTLSVVEILAEITRGVVAQENINDTLAMVLEGVARMGNFHAVFLALLNTRKDRLIGRLGYGAGVADYLSGLQVALEPGAGVLAEAVLGRAPIVVTDGSSAMLVAHGVAAPAIPAASFVVHPLVVRGKAVGVMVASRGLGAARVSAADLTVVQLFCNQAVLALDRAAS